MSKILLEIPDQLLRQVDAKAKINHLKRSEAARQALSFWIKEGQDHIPPMERPGIREMIREMDAFRHRGRSRKSSEQLIREDRESH